MEIFKKNENKNMRNAYVSAIVMTVVLSLAVYAVVIITLRIKSWFD
jgi:hypothetical protein